jgi:hypothetical protein
MKHVIYNLFLQWRIIQIIYKYTHSNWTSAIVKLHWPRDWSVDPSLSRFFMLTKVTYVGLWLQINAMYPVGQQVKNCWPARTDYYINQQNGGTTRIISKYDFPSLCSNKECKREEKYTTGNSRICCWNRLSRFF